MGREGREGGRSEVWERNGKCVEREGEEGRCVTSGGRVVCKDDYKGLQRITKDYKGLQRITKDYVGLLFCN